MKRTPYIASFAILIAGICYLSLIGVRSSEAQDAKVPEKSKTTSPNRTSYILPYGERPPVIEREDCPWGFSLELSLSVPELNSEGHEEYLGIGALAWPTEIFLTPHKDDLVETLPKEFSGKLFFNSLKNKLVGDVYVKLPFYKLEDAFAYAWRAEWSISGGGLNERVKIPAPLDYEEELDRTGFRNLVHDYEDSSALVVHCEAHIPLSAYQSPEELLFFADFEIENDICKYELPRWSSYDSRFDCVVSYESTGVAVQAPPLLPVDLGEEKRICVKAPIGPKERSRVSAWTILSKNGRSPHRISSTRETACGVVAESEKLPVSTLLQEEEVAITFEPRFVDSTGASLTPPVTSVLRNRKWWLEEGRLRSSPLDQEYDRLTASEQLLIVALDDLEDGVLAGLTANAPRLYAKDVDRRGVLDLGSFDACVDQVLEEDEILLTGRLIAPGGTWPKERPEGFQVYLAIESSLFWIKEVSNKGEDYWQLSRFGASDYASFQTIDVSSDGTFVVNVSPREWGSIDEEELPERAIDAQPVFEPKAKLFASLDQLQWRVRLTTKDGYSLWDQLDPFGQPSKFHLEAQSRNSRVISFKDLQMPGGLVTFNARLVRPKCFDDGSFPKELYDEYEINREYSSDNLGEVGVNITFNSCFGERQWSSYWEYWQVGKPFSYYSPAIDYDVQARTYLDNYDPSYGGTNPGDSHHPFTVGASYSEAREFHTPFVPLNVEEGKRIEVDLPFYRHFHRVKVLTPEGPAEVARFVAFARYAGPIRSCITGQMTNFENHQEFIQYAEKLREGWTLRCADDEVWPLPNLNRDTYGTGLDNLKGVVMRQGPSPHYVCTSTGPLPIIALAWTKDYAPEWVWLEHNQEEATIQLSRKRVDRPGRRPKHLWGDPGYRKFARYSGWRNWKPHLRVRSPKIIGDQSALRDKSAWLSLRRPDGVVTKDLWIWRADQLDGRIHMPGQWQAWFERDPLNDDERASEVVSFLVLARHNPNSNRSPDGLLASELVLPVVPDSLFQERARKHPSFTLDGQKMHPQVKWVDAQGTPIYLGNHSLGDTGTDPGTRVDWSKSLKSPALGISRSVKDLWEPLNFTSNCKLRLDVHELMKSDDTLLIDILGLDDSIAYTTFVHPGKVTPIFLPEGVSSLSLNSNRERRRWDTIVYRPENPDRIIEIALPNLRTDLSPVVEVDDSWYDSRDPIEYFSIDVNNRAGTNGDSWQLFHAKPERFDRLLVASFGPMFFGTPVGNISLLPCESKILDAPRIAVPSLDLILNAEQEEQLERLNDAECEVMLAVIPHRLVTGKGWQVTKYDDGIPYQAFTNYDIFYEYQKELEQVTRLYPADIGTNVIVCMVNGVPVGHWNHNFELGTDIEVELPIALPEVHEIRLEFNQGDSDLINHDVDEHWRLERRVPGLPTYSRELDTDWADERAFIFDVIPPGDYELVQYGGYLDYSCYTERLQPVQRIPLRVAGDLTMTIPLRVIADDETFLTSARPSYQTVSIPIPEEIRAKAITDHVRLIWQDDNGFPLRVHYPGEYARQLRTLRSNGELQVVLPSEARDSRFSLLVLLEELGPMVPYEGAKHAWLSNLIRVTPKGNEFEAASVTWSRPVIVDSLVEARREYKEHGWGHPELYLKDVLELPNGDRIPFATLLNLQVDSCDYRMYSMRGIGPILPRGRSVLNVYDHKGELTYQCAFDVPEDARGYTIPEDISDSLTQLGILGERD